MDRIFQILYSIVPILHIIAACALIFKAIIVFRNKGFSVPAVMTSFFRIYSSSDMRMTSNEARQQYMKINNFINYYLYAWLFLTLVIIIVFGKFY